MERLCSHSARCIAARWQAVAAQRPCCAPVATSASCSGRCGCPPRPLHQLPAHCCRGTEYACFACFHNCSVSKHGKCAVPAAALPSMRCQSRQALSCACGQGRTVFRGAAVPGTWKPAVAASADLQSWAAARCSAKWCAGCALAYTRLLSRAQQPSALRQSRGAVATAQRTGRRRTQAAGALRP